MLGFIDAVLEERCADVGGELNDCIVLAATPKDVVT